MGFNPLRAKCFAKINCKKPGPINRIGSSCCNPFPTLVLTSVEVVDVDDDDDESLLATNNDDVVRVLVDEGTTNASTTTRAVGADDNETNKDNDNARGNFMICYAIVCDDFALLCFVLFCFGLLWFALLCFAVLYEVGCVVFCMD